MQKHIQIQMQIKKGADEYGDSRLDTDSILFSHLYAYNNVKKDSFSGEASVANEYKVANANADENINYFCKCLNSKWQTTFTKENK